MKRKNISRILWGIGFLLAGIFLLLEQLHLISLNLSLWTIIWTIIFAALGVSSIANKNIFGSVFSIAFLVIVYAKPLHITKLVPWTILLVALLISIGLSIIFKKSIVENEIIVNGKRVDWKDVRPEPFHAQEVISQTSKTETGEEVVISQKLSDTSRYIRSQNLHSVTINSFVGDAEIYLNHAKAAGESVIFNINASIGDIDIYLPNSWQIVNELDSTFGNIDYFGHSSETGTKLILRGSKKVGDLGIHFVE
ncbi:putative membrane protein [Lactobacillus colini]|uniref:Membrane protein n=1 Tax=Lactobacillus colini TaxID=1819254 RepID=A0ABS4MFT5_9LACO|nr:LiaF domain-containing protein [Lactobacillus colini]MBP2058550.1 putative membrane protein [Lactobacillus colini]